MKRPVDKKVIAVFESLAPMLEAETGGPVHLVKIKGSRLSYVAGRVPVEMPFTAPQRVILCNDWALMFYLADGRDIDSQQVGESFNKQLFGDFNQGAGI